MSLVNEVNSLLFAISLSAGELQGSSLPQVHGPFCVGVHRRRLGWDGVKCRDSKESPRLHSPFHPAKCLKCHLIPKTVTAVITQPSSVRTGGFGLASDSSPGLDRRTEWLHGRDPAQEGGWA